MTGVIFIRHANPNPCRPACHFFTDQDTVLARLLTRHRLLAPRQLERISELLPRALPGRSRYARLVKYGFVNKYEMMDMQGRRAGSFYTLGPAAKVKALTFDPSDIAISLPLLACNQLIIAGLSDGWDMEYRLEPGSPVPCWLHSRGRLYAVVVWESNPSGLGLGLSGATRALVVVKNAAEAASAAAALPVPLRFVLWQDLLDWRASLWRLENDRLIPAGAGFAGNTPVQEPKNTLTMG